MEKVHGKVLVVDDELSILKSVKRILRNSNCALEIIMDPLKALRRLDEEYFDVICCDFNMPKLDGVSLLKNAKQLHPHSKRILMSGKADFDVLSNAVNEVGIYRFLEKPFTYCEVLSAIEQAIENKVLFDENLHLSSTISEQNAKTQ